MNAYSWSRLIPIGFLSGLAIGYLPAQAPANAFLQHNLVSDLPNVADHQDKNLVNPWGIGFGQTPFWVGDNGTGLSTLYDGTGTPNAAIVVAIPGAGGAATGGKVTGVILNAFSANTSAFALAAGRSPNFMFCTEDGVLAGWNPSVDSSHAKVIFDNSKSGADYTGCALGGSSLAPLVFAANFSAATVDVFNGAAALNPGAFAHAFVNPGIPAGYAPFDVMIINTLVYVTYALQDSTKKISVPGAGNGYVAIFDQQGSLVMTLISQGALNAPWGMAVAPATFGPFGGDLLVGNLGDGRINAFDPLAGTLVGTLNDVNGKPISVQGLWSIAFGSGAQKEDPGTLYFTAGSGTLGTATDPFYSHGLLGSIQAAPSFTAAGIVNAGSNLPGPLAANTWMIAKGSAMSATTATAAVGNGNSPTSTGGVSVTVNGQPALVNSVSNTAVEFLVPSNIAAGTAQIVINNNGLASAPVTATVATLAPAFFTQATAAKNGDLYIVASHGTGVPVAPTGFLGAATFSAPAEPGETIALMGTGFGASFNGPVLLTLPVAPVFVIDGIVATTTFAGPVGPGLFQFSVQVPPGVTLGQDALVVAFLGDAVTQVNAFIPIATQ